MPIEIKNCKIAECGTGIKADGKLDLKITNAEFRNNEKDIDIHSTTDSNISLTDIESFNCATASISITEFDQVIEKVDTIAKSSGDFNEEEYKKFKEIIKKMEESKDKPTKIKKLMSELYGMGKACIPTILHILFEGFQKGIFKM